MKKFEVEFLNAEGERFLLFVLGVSPFIAAEEDNEGYWQQHFTEQEIKDIDERYWMFAVSVEEDE